MEHTLSFSSLPQEIIFYIFSFLDPRTLLCAALVCTRWRIYSNLNSLWKSLYDRYYQDVYHVPQNVSNWKQFFLQISRIHFNWRNGNGQITQLNEPLQFVRHVFLRGSHLFYSSGDSFYVWSLSSQKVENQIRISSPWVKSLHVTDVNVSDSDESRNSLVFVATGPSWRTLSVYELNGEVQTTLQTQMTIECVRTLSNCQLLLCSNVLEVWDLERRVSTLRCHQRHLHSAINSLDIHHPTELIACVHKGKRVRFWDRRVGNRFQEILTTGHAHLVHAVAFTKYPTSSKISTTTTTTSTSTATTDWLMVTASKDTTARLWDIRTLGSRAVPLAILREHAAAIRAVSMDRSKIITGGKDGMVILWDPTRPLDTLASPIISFSSSIPFLWGWEPIYTLDVLDHLLVTGHLNSIYLYNFNVPTPSSSSSSSSSLSSLSPTSEQLQHSHTPLFYQSFSNKFCVLS